MSGVFRDGKLVLYRKVEVFRRRKLLLERMAVGSPADLGFTIENLPANSPVDIMVTAVNNGGESPVSEVITITTH